MSRKILAGIIAIAAAAIAFPAAASETTTTPVDGVVPVSQVVPEGRLSLTVTSSQDVLRVSSLSCGPAGGQHPNADAACTELGKVAGDFTALNVTPEGACTLQYDPVTVRARGYWDGKPIDHHETFGNLCAMMLTTGPVFAI
ncbi:MAG: subtilase-type protease inhibitor [Actinomycetota bacterium]|nr:subtilase-type protease inhibitor [Actinomycetota bacterium]